MLTTPLMVGGRLLTNTNLGQAAAIDPATGETTWVYQHSSGQCTALRMRPAAPLPACA